MGSHGKIQPSTQLFCIHKHGWNCAEDSLIKRTTFNTQSLKPKGTKSITYYIKSTASMVETWTSNPIFFILLSSVFELQDLAASKKCALFRTWTTPVQYDRGLIAWVALGMLMHFALTMLWRLAKAGFRPRLRVHSLKANGGHIASIRS